jgi:L-alanine-DL-glutamate epimerase-like enolase superfamily enzyme
VTRIVGLRADKVRVPFRRPFLTSTDLWLERESWILTVVTSTGARGYGEAVLEPRDGETAHAVLDQLVREAATMAGEGNLPGDTELDRHGAAGRALRAGLAAAQLDLEEPPVRRLRPDGPGVGVNATIASVGPAASAQAALQALEAGFRTIKLKAGAERETEALVDRVRAVREAVGPGVRIRVDVNGAWDAGTAVERLSAIERFVIEYVEEPLAAADPLDLAQLRRRVDVPIAADESVSSVSAARALIEAEAVDALVVKLSRVGGVNGAAEIAGLAARRGIPVVLSTLFETGIGVAAALHVAATLEQIEASARTAPPHLDHGLATAGLLEHDLLELAFAIEDGRMWLPEPGAAGVTGGLGIALDDAAVRRYAVESIGAGA